MKRPNITIRDLKIFFLGMFFMLLVDAIFNWKNLREGFKDGYNAARTDQLN